MTMTPAHTSGPWRVEEPGPHYLSSVGVSARDGAVTIYDAPLTAETRANALLIAVAPELLALVQLVANIGKDRSLRGDLLAGMRPHEAASFDKLCADSVALIARTQGDS